MKKLAIAFDFNSPRVSFIKEILDGKYEILEACGLDQTRKLLDESFNDLSLLIVDNPSSFKNIDMILKQIHGRNNYMFSLPVLLLSDLELMEKDDRYLNSPVMGIVSTSDSERTILTRVNNSIKLCESISFDAFSDMLKALPSLIYLKDKNGKYVFCSQNWHHIDESYESIRGKTDFDVRKNKENAILARKSDLQVIESKKGQAYVIKEDDKDGLEYFQIIKEPLKNENDEVYGIIALINNVTESELLRQELREKSIKDPLTGLYNRLYFEELIHQENPNLEYPLTIISADCDDLKKINDEFGHHAGDIYICYARDALLENLPKGSYLFRMGGDEFIAMVQNTNKEQAKQIVDGINESINKFRNPQFELKMSVGSWTLMDKGISLESGVAKSDKEMYKTKKQHKDASE